MLELERAIDEFDNFSTNLCSDLRESWQRIKAFYEAQNTAHNTTKVKICQLITDDILNYLTRESLIGRCNDGHDDIRDNIFSIINGKL